MLEIGLEFFGVLFIIVKLSRPQLRQHLDRSPM